MARYKDPYNLFDRLLDLTHAHLPSAPHKEEALPKNPDPDYHQDVYEDREPDFSAMVKQYVQEEMQIPLNPTPMEFHPMQEAIDFQHQNEIADIDGPPDYDFDAFMINHAIDSFKDELQRNAPEVVQPDSIADKDLEEIINPFPNEEIPAFEDMQTMEDALRMENPDKFFRGW